MPDARPPSRHAEVHSHRAAHAPRQYAPLRTDHPNPPHLRRRKRRKKGEHARRAGLQDRSARHTRLAPLMDWRAARRATRRAASVCESDTVHAVPVTNQSDDGGEGRPPFSLDSQWAAPNAESMCAAAVCSFSATVHNCSSSVGWYAKADEGAPAPCVTGSSLDGAGA